MIHIFELRWRVWINTAAKCSRFCQIFCKYYLYFESDEKLHKIFTECCSIHHLNLYRQPVIALLDKSQNLPSILTIPKGRYKKCAWVSTINFVNIIMQEFRIKEFRCKYYVSEICIVLYEFIFCIDFILVHPNKKHFLYHRYNFLIFMHELQLPYARHHRPLLIRSRSWIQAIHQAKGHST